MMSYPEEQKDENLFDWNPSIGINEQTYNATMEEVEDAVASIGGELCNVLGNQQFAAECEREAWLSWLRAQRKYIDAACYLHIFDQQRKIMANIEKYKSKMDEYFYSKIKLETYRLLKSSRQGYERCEKAMDRQLSNCREYLVAASYARNGLRRLSYTDSAKFGSMAVYKTPPVKSKIGLRIEYAQLVISNRGSKLLRFPSA